MSVQSVSILNYSLTQDATSAAALLNLTVTAELGISGSITDVAASDSGSRRRSLLSTSTGMPMAPALKRKSVQARKVILDLDHGPDGAQACCKCSAASLLDSITL